MGHLLDKCMEKQERRKQRRADKQLAMRLQREEFEALARQQLEEVARQRQQQHGPSTSTAAAGAARALPEQEMVGVLINGSPCLMSIRDLELLIGPVQFAEWQQRRTRQPAPRPATREEIATLPTRIWKADESRVQETQDQQKLCSICLASFEDGESVKTLPCLHQFHSACIDRALAQNSRCPICRAETV